MTVEGFQIELSSRGRIPKRDSWRH